MSGRKKLGRPAGPKKVRISAQLWFTREEHAKVAAAVEAARLPTARWLTVLVLRTVNNKEEG